MFDRLAGNAAAALSSAAVTGMCSASAECGAAYSRCGTAAGACKGWRLPHWQQHVVAAGVPRCRMMLTQHATHAHPPPAARAPAAAGAARLRGCILPRRLLLRGR
jgi:hypothetical protein